MEEHVSLSMAMEVINVYVPLVSQVHDVKQVRKLHRILRNAYEWHELISRKVLFTYIIDRFRRRMYTKSMS
jgi:hypothetical protein